MNLLGLNLSNVKSVYVRCKCNCIYRMMLDLSMIVKKVGISILLVSMYFINYISIL